MCFRVGLLLQVTREWMEEVNAVKPVFTDETIGGTCSSLFHLC